MDGAASNALASTSLALTLAAALAALVVIGILMVWRGADWRVLLAPAGLLLAALALTALIDTFGFVRQAVARRALVARIAALDRSALAPGSALACLDGGAGEKIEDACEKAVFASPQAVAAAVAYMAARLQLLWDGAAFAGDKEVGAALAASRRAFELDRFGVAAQVLAHRDGCTAAHCAAFKLLGDTSALKASLKADSFSHLVDRYAAGWSAPAVAKAPTSVEAPAPVATEATPIKPGEPWDFPSAASIPPISIMNAEPPPKKEPASEAKPEAKPASKTEPASEPRRAAKPVTPRPSQPAAPPPMQLHN